MTGERFDIVTALTPEAAAERLRAATEPVNLLRWGPTTALFEGRVQAMQFRVRPITSYRRAFLPWFCGRIDAAPTGARLSVVMRAGYLALILSAAWIAVVAAAAEFLAWRLAPSGFPGQVWLGLPPAIAVIIAVMVRGNYRREAARQKQRFLGLFAHV